MKKTQLLNTEISYLIASLGHKDVIGITNPSFSIDDETGFIDLALRKNMPPFLTVLKTVLKEMKIEEFIINKQLESEDKEIFDEVKKLSSKYNIKLTFITQNDFVNKSKNTKSLIRTGDFTKFTNILLVAGDITK